MKSILIKFILTWGMSKFSLTAVAICGTVFAWNVNHVVNSLSRSDTKDSVPKNVLMPPDELAMDTGMLPGMGTSTLSFTTIPMPPKAKDMSLNTELWLRKHWEEDLIKRRLFITKTVSPQTIAPKTWRFFPAKNTRTGMVVENTLTQDRQSLKESLVGGAGIQKRSKERPWVLTFYDACFLCCGKSLFHPLHGITASGVRAFRGVIACPPWMPFGKMVLIPSEYGFKLPYFCLDRGSSIQGHRLDIFVPTHSEALRRGISHAEVEIIK